MGWNYALKTISCVLCSRTANGTANRYEGEAATHGYYGSNGNWVGMVLLDESLSGYDITSINLTLTANTAGTTARKTVYLYTSNYQTFSASGRGSIYPNSQIGSISEAFRNATKSIDLSGSALTSMASYLSGGNRMIILYDPTGSAANYCRFTNIIVKIGYRWYVEDQRTVMIKSNGSWMECVMSIKKNGAWSGLDSSTKKINTEVYIKRNGEWVKTSHR